MSLLRKIKKNNGQQRASGSKEFVIDSDHRVMLNSKGLIPVVIQDANSQEVLHLGYMDRWALDTTLEKKRIHLFRRSSGRIEKYGEKKGVDYKIKSFKLDRSKRSLLLKVVAKDEEGGMRSSYIEEVDFTN